ncbi:MAG: SAF domain-containing protein, partial [Alphaproteobacteria bacterium]|nr:SAF domain-containing protein [Alphaproteobacteria bacterium]
PDVPASLTFAQFRQLADARGAFAEMDANPVDKDAAADELESMRGLFTKSLAPSRALAKGTVLTAEMLTAKKPGTGIAAARMDEILGRTLARDVLPDRLLRPEDLQ